MNRGETMDIGQRIRFVRLFRGMKQEELAEKIGLGGGENGRTRISQYENGQIKKLILNPKKSAMMIT